MQRQQAEHTNKRVQLCAVWARADGVDVDGLNAHAVLSITAAVQCRVGP
jgi:hypothetical protein